jgi:hypothetical protein
MLDPGCSILDAVLFFLWERLSSRDIEAESLSRRAAA